MSTKSRFAPLVCIFVAILPLIVLQNVEAHDGGFGHSRRTIFFDATADSFVLEYRVTRNSDEALLEITLIDADGDGQISAAEQQTYFQSLGNELARQFDIRTEDNVKVEPRLVEHHLQPNLVQCFRYSMTTMAAEIRFVDRNFPHKPGVVKVLAGSGVKAELAEPMDLNHAERVSLKVVRTGR